MRIGYVVAMICLSSAAMAHDTGKSRPIARDQTKAVEPARGPAGQPEESGGNLKALPDFLRGARFGRGARGTGEQPTADTSPSVFRSMFSFEDSKAPSP